jgi:hypothetical protein
MRLPPLYLEEILDWSDSFFDRHRRYPKKTDGKIPGQLGLRWSHVDQSLSQGGRGLPRVGSLAVLLLERRGRRHKGRLPRYTYRQLLTWADAHKAKTGRFPTADSGAVADAPGETWGAVDHALMTGLRGLPGGSSLSQFLADRRGTRNHMRLPPLSVERVLRYADRHHRQTGKWPTRHSGPVQNSKGETWAGIDAALVAGSRGLAGYGSLARLLDRKRGVPNRKALPRLTERQIARWAREHVKRTGRWPGHLDGEIPGSAGVTWSAVESALKQGGRGLPGGDSLYRLELRQGRRGLSAKA